MEKKNLTERFMSIHEKPSTRFNKNLKKVYEMLDKYGTKHEDVDKVFNRATLKEKLKMVKLLKEGAFDNEYASGSGFFAIGIEDSKKKFKSKGRVANSEALKQILNIIDTLTEAEKRNMWLEWREDYDVAYDSPDGDFIVVVEPATEVERIEYRIIANWEYAGKLITEKLGCATQYFIWDMYANKKDKGSWTSAEKLSNGLWVGNVFETEDAAFDAGLYHLNELEDEGELEYRDSKGNWHDAEPDDFVIDTITVAGTEIDWSDSDTEIM